MRRDFKREAPGGFTHVCMPVLYLSGLIFLRVSRSKTRPYIHYETLPLYLKGIAKCLGVSYERLAAIIGRLVGLPVEKIKHGDEVEGYGRLRLDAMSRVVDICSDLAPLVEKDRWTTLLAVLIGQTPAMPYSLRILARYHVLMYVLPLALCYQGLGSKEEILFVCAPGWPQEWITVVRRRVQDLQFVAFAWPRWYIRLYRLLVGAAIYLSLPAITLALVCKRGIVFDKRTKKHFKIMTEFVDPLRLNRTPFDADYLVDGTTIKESDLLMFLTREQMKILERYGYNLKNIVEILKARKYELAVLYRLPFTAEMLRSLARLYCRAVANHSGDSAILLGWVFFRAWREYLEYQPVFDHYEIDSVFYLTAPHGRTPDRWNSALITGLGRKRSIRVFGCQTRAVDSTQYVYAFECFDGYFSWGKGWQEPLGEATVYMGRLTVVGCIHLDTLKPIYRDYLAKHEDKASANQRPTFVSIFTSDIDLEIGVYSGSYYPLRYTMSLLESCVELALAHRDIKFVVKTKDPDHVELILQQGQFRKIYEQARDNITFEKRVRCDYLDLLSASDIVIAIGYTSPGVEGLFLGKRVIYYSNLVGHGQCFKVVPDLVAENQHDLARLFEQALQDYREYAEIHEKQISTLEPFRDGKTRGRILWELAS